MSRVHPRSIIGFVLIVLTMVGFMVYVGLVATSESCWDKYSTENETIINCEGSGK